MRTFIHGEGSAQKFWRIEISGRALEITSGKVGSKGRTQVRTLPDESEAREEHNRLLWAKRRAGFEEQWAEPPPVQLGRLGKALEQALVEDPGDLAAHMAYADWLLEQPDPRLGARGEFIQLHLALEDASRSPAERKKLKKRETQLRAQHERDWLGPRLAMYLLDHHNDDLPEYCWSFGGRRGTRTYARGWVDSLEIEDLSDDLALRLAEAPCLRLLRRLVVKEVDDTGASGAPLALLGDETSLGNLRVLEVRGNWGYDVKDFVSNLPHLEEVRVTASANTAPEVFGLRNLTHLRVLQVDAATDYPLEKLAANPVLANLTHLSLHPHAYDSSDNPSSYLPLEKVRPLLRSKHLKSLTHLTLRLSDMGDKGCRAIVDSGILKRLKVLDLKHGCITDEGARTLADCPALKNLKALYLGHNRLTRAGARALKDTGIEVHAGDQQTRNEDGEYDDDYLYEGDCE
jgi:uncharacterized protein (TIGR02996 family)